MKRIVLANVLFVLLFSRNVINAAIGINWSRRTPTRMIPSMVVDVLLQNKVKEAKIYEADEDVIRAFSGADIGLTINVRDLTTVSSLELARDWVKQKILNYPKANIKYVLVGRSNAFGFARFLNESLSDIVKVYGLIQQALNDANLNTKAILTHSFTGVMKTNATMKPSEYEFLDSVKEAMVAYLKIAAENDCPFVYDFFPISFIYSYKLDFNFGFLDNNSTYMVKDGDAVYHNVFELAHDSFAWALKKAGAPDDMKIVVGQIGWPTDGFEGANAVQAEHFFKTLLPFVMSDRGTPMRPGAPIDVYIHSLTDEKYNPGFVSFTRHWGIFRSNGQPKYKIDLSGQGRDIFPTPLKGIGLMPRRWCVFNGDMSNMTKVNKVYNETCNVADCSSMVYGGSCSMLSFKENVSYAFNSYFQSSFQEEDACNFEGLGEITVKNPSRDGCVFTVEVVRGNLGNDYNANGGRVDGMPDFVIVAFVTFLLLASFF